MQAIKTQAYSIIQGDFLHWAIAMLRAEPISKLRNFSQQLTIPCSGMKILPYFLCCSNFSLSDKYAPHHPVREHGGNERGLLYKWKKVLLSELHHFSDGCDPGFFSYLIWGGGNRSRSLVTPVMQSYGEKKKVCSDFWKYECSMQDLHFIFISKDNT